MPVHIPFLDCLLLGCSEISVRPISWGRCLQMFRPAVKRWSLHTFQDEELEQGDENWIDFFLGLAWTNMCVLR